MTLEHTAQTWRAVSPVAHTDAPTEGETRYAVSALYAEHATSMLRVATVMLGDQSAVAEDVVRDAYLARYAGPSSGATWSPTATAP